MTEFGRTRRTDGLVGFIKEWSPLIAAIFVGVATWYQYQNRVLILEEKVTQAVPVIYEAEHRVTILEQQVKDILSGQIRIERKLDWLTQREDRHR